MRHFNCMSERTVTDRLQLASKELTRVILPSQWTPITNSGGNTEIIDTD